MIHIVDNAFGVSAFFVGLYAVRIFLKINSPMRSAHHLELYSVFYDFGELGVTKISTAYGF